MVVHILRCEGSSSFWFKYTPTNSLRRQLDDQQIKPQISRYDFFLSINYYLVKIESIYVTVWMRVFPIRSKQSLKWPQPSSSL